MQWTGTIWTILKEGHIRIIPTKFGQNPASSLGEDVVWSNCWDGRRTSNDHNSSPWANGSGELNTVAVVTEVPIKISRWEIFCGTVALVSMINIINSVADPEGVHLNPPPLSAPWFYENEIIWSHQVISFSWDI